MESTAERYAVQKNVIDYIFLLTDRKNWIKIISVLVLRCRAVEV